MLTVIWLGVAGTATLWGLEYYLLPLDQRAFSPLAPTFSPTGVVGHGLGVLGTAMILLGIVGYMARKRIRFLHRAGPLKHWLQVHIFLCTLGPFLVLLHTSLKFGGLVSVAFWSMSAVVASGVFGRFVYVRIPKTLNGQFLGLDAVRARLETMGEELTREMELSPPVTAALQTATGSMPSRPPGLVGAVALAARESVGRPLRLRGLRQALQHEGLPRTAQDRLVHLASEQRRLRQQALLLRPFHRLFGYWHVFHLPLTVVMVVILGVHVAVSILFGYTWIF